MTKNGLLVPIAYQEDEATCNVCLAVRALDEAQKIELRALQELELRVLIDNGDQPFPVETSYRMLQEFKESFHATQTEYGIAFAVSLTLYHTVEKPERHKDSREVLTAYQEYRACVSESYAASDALFSTLFTHLQQKGWSESIGSAVATLHLAHQNTKLKESAFWALTDKWTDDRHDRGWDFLDELF